MSKFQAPRGTHDVLPRDHLWWHVIRTIEEQCAQYGWSRVSTPGFEETTLFERTAGEASDVVHKEMYSFVDRGDRSLTLRPEGTGAEVWMPEGERERLERYPDFAPVGVPGRPHAPEHLVSGGETIEVAGISFECLAVPGHSPAHVAYYAEGELFSGDLLFAGSVGRVDLPGADWETLLASVKMLAERLPPETVVHPGHERETTLGVELARNPYLAELRAQA